MSDDTSSHVRVSHLYDELLFTSWGRLSWQLAGFWAHVKCCAKYHVVRRSSMHILRILKMWNIREYLRILQLATNIIICYFSSFIFWNKRKLCWTIGIIYNHLPLYIRYTVSIIYLWQLRSWSMVGTNHYSILVPHNKVALDLNIFEYLQTFKLVSTLQTFMHVKVWSHEYSINATGYSVAISPYVVQGV